MVKNSLQKDYKEKREPGDAARKQNRGGISAVIVKIKSGFRRFLCRWKYVLYACVERGNMQRYKKEIYLWFYCFNIVYQIIFFYKLLTWISNKVSKLSEGHSSTQWKIPKVSFTGWRRRDVYRLLWVRRGFQAKISK